MFANNPPQHWRDYFTGAQYLFASLPSTQQYVRAHEPTLAPIYCRALTQTHGEGQRARVWQQYGEALLFSCAITLPGDITLQQGLTQAIALAIVGALDPAGQHLQLKWPNDIYHQHGKLAGILLESCQHPLDHRQSQVIIGIGINIGIHIDKDKANAQSPQTNIACWQDIYPNDDSESVLDKIMPAIIRCVEQWAQTPYLPINHRWSDYDRYHQQVVTLANQSEHMQILGIDQKGRLLCRDSDNTLHYLTNTRIVGDTNECTY